MGQPSVNGQIAACPICGVYEIDFRALALLSTHPERAHLLAAKVFHEKSESRPTTVSFADVEAIASTPVPLVTRRLELLLAEIIRQSNGRLAFQFALGNLALRSASYSATFEDVEALCNELQLRGALASSNHPNTGELIVGGWTLYQDLAKERATLSQAFVAMHFDTQILPLYDSGIRQAVENAGYEPLRIDRKEHDGKIDDQIVAEIRRSKFMIADFTGHRGGVYYEVGFAHGQDIRVIFTCRKDALADLHFDVRQYSTILWNRPTDLLKPLQNKILALFGAGPLNPGAKPLS